MLPEFLRDISVTNAMLPVELDGATARGVLWQAAPGRFLLDVPGVARYLVESGNAVTIDPVLNVHGTALEYYLRMLPLAALLYQRGLLAFHAAAVANKQGAILLSGDSGSGKSTLMMELLKRGWRMLADDLAIVGLDKQGHPVVYATNPGIALWPKSLEKLEIDFASFAYVDANRRQFVPAGRIVDQPQPLLGIYRLGVHSKDVVELDTIDGSARFRGVGTMMYNSHVADVLCSRVDYLRNASSIAQSVSLKILRRPRGVWSVDLLTEYISQ